MRWLIRQGRGVRSVLRFSSGARAQLRHFDGVTVTDETTPIFNHDVDARADAVWVVGHGGAAVRSAGGWCHVAIVS